MCIHKGIPEVWMDDIAFMKELTIPFSSIAMLIFVKQSLNPQVSTSEHI